MQVAHYNNNRVVRAGTRALGIAYATWNQLSQSQRRQVIEAGKYVLKRGRDWYNQLPQKRLKTGKAE